VVTWFRDRNHNPTEFTQDLPELIELGKKYRLELIQKFAQNPERMQTYPHHLIMAQGIFNFGMFAHRSEQNIAPNESDYVIHLSFMILRECCLNDKVPSILPRILLNNIALKLGTQELEFRVPTHQNWALEIFDCIRSDLVPDFITKLKINQLITEQVLIDITKKQLA